MDKEYSIKEDIDSNNVGQIGNIEKLKKAMDQLEKSDRELIIMNKYQKLKYSEIASITNSSVGSLKTKMHRAIHKLRVYYFQNNQ